MPQHHVPNRGLTKTTQVHACGNCAACCTHLLIPAGDVGPGAKPAGVRCVNLTSAGCRIYGCRPETCVKFSCAWLGDTEWPESWRPERSELLCLRAEIEKDRPAAAIYELEPDALQSSIAADILSELKRTTTVVAVIDAQQERRKLQGNWVASPAQPAVPAPHFVRRLHTKGKSDSVLIRQAGE
jgi:hypothetical protein